MRPISTLENFTNTRGSLNPAAYAEASQASLELLAMGPQLNALDKRLEGELSQVFADILLQHSVSSSFRSKVRLRSVFCHFARLCEMSLPLRADLKLFYRIIPTAFSVMRMLAIV